MAAFILYPKGQAHVSFAPLTRLWACSFTVEVFCRKTDKVCHCTRCPELVKDRDKTVFGEGNEKARLVICGESPGENEAKEGRPFVGKAGQLLDNILKSCGLKREDTYICNVLRCRPPNNRKPFFETWKNLPKHKV